LEILKYCEASETLKLEKEFIELLKPEYNIVQDPTLPPMSGQTHFKETRKKMSYAHKGQKHPNFGKTLSQETRKNMSAAQKGAKNSENEPNFFLVFRKGNLIQCLENQESKGQKTLSTNRSS
jgi:group I intron endonuclease